MLAERGAKRKNGLMAETERLEEDLGLQHGEIPGANVAETTELPVGCPELLWATIRTLTNCPQEVPIKPRSRCEISASRAFKLTVTDAYRFVSKVEPKELALGAGESGTVRVDLTIPAGTAAGTGDDHRNSEGTFSRSP